MDFEVYDRYPCQRAINIVFVVVTLFLLLLMFIAGARLFLFLYSSSSPTGGSVPVTRAPEAWTVMPPRPPVG